MRLDRTDGSPAHTLEHKTTLVGLFSKSCNSSIPNVLDITHAPDYWPTLKAADVKNGGMWELEPLAGSSCLVGHRETLVWFDLIES